MKINPKKINKKSKNWKQDKVMYQIMSLKCMQIGFKNKMGLVMLIVIKDNIKQVKKKESKKQEKEKKKKYLNGRNLALKIKKNMMNI